MDRAFPANAGFQKNIRAGWVGDLLTRDHLLAGGVKINAPLFNSADAVKVVVGVGGAAANAVAIPVAALSEEIPAGSVITLGAVDSKKFAALSAKALKAATSLAVQPIPTALVANDTGYYNAPGSPKRIAASTAVGLTNAELENAGATGVLWGPAADGDDVIRLLAYDIADANVNNDGDLLRPGTLIKVNFMPSWAGMSAAVKAKVRATYEVTVGTPGDEVPAS